MSYPSAYPPALAARGGTSSLGWYRPSLIGIKAAWCGPLRHPPRLMWERCRRDGRGFTANSPVAGKHCGHRPAQRLTKTAMTEAAKVQSIYRYPVKGLSPEPLPRADLAVGET